MSRNHTLEVELIFDADCPNVEPTQTRLREALVSLGLCPLWQEWARGSDSCPAHAARYGSPTVLVNGKDVAGIAPCDGSACCRLYPSEAGKMRGVPPIELIVAALREPKAANGIS